MGSRKRPSGAARELGAAPRPPRAAGRRPGDSGTREAILEAARAAFAAAGYDRATIRGIAAAADVDPALVLHYFGTKEELFEAALELPVRPREILARGIAAGRDQLGATIVRTLPRGLGAARDPGAPHGHAALRDDQRDRHGHDPRPARARGLRAHHRGARRARCAAARDARRLAVHRPRR